MCYFIGEQIIRRRTWFSGPVTGTPQATLYIDNVATGSPINGSGSDEAWAFTVSLPAELTIGSSVQIVAFAEVSGTAEQRELAAGSVIQITDLSSIKAGMGDIPVDHNYGGVDELRVTDNQGMGLDRVAIVAYLAEDYDASNRGSEWIRGRSVTTADGRWQLPIMLVAGDYVIITSRGKWYGSEITRITVE